MIRARPSGPRPGKELLGEPVQLADVPEGEGAQEGPKVQGAMTRRPSTRLVAPQRSRSASWMQSLQHRMHQGQQLAAGPGRASQLAQVDQLIGGLLDAQPLGQGGRQQQPGVGCGSFSGTG